ncbi:MAG: sigma-70 family RNA polymerase sigma factor [Pirellulales bacterium]|nr:sigma-70 family RNA polymerase sigma factor [Pirellulales bacterium]
MSQEEPGQHTLLIEDYIRKLAKGDDSARERLLQTACDRLMHITRKILRDFPDVQRWEQTADVFQNASLRLYRALGEVTPNDARHFYRLAAMQIRRELIDLARHYGGPQGMGKHHFSQLPKGNQESMVFNALDQGRGTLDPGKISEWVDFHEAIGKLPEEEREVFDLIWYHGLSQQAAGELLKVDERTIRRRWREARLKLHELLGGEMPELE